ncbi:hypothetical protein G7Y89_g9159 [Cudoniella acicularis]|uniref:Uncharacterized protein n=1 Tax=Cudoniella acicularis TaxID=354080 RepID=A0A8H4VZW8_9HELO|nr:hypothetical protein G7Y89_g9159 [Cudoniella acicularis]
MTSPRDNEALSEEVPLKDPRFIVDIAASDNTPTTNIERGPLEELVHELLGFVNTLKESVSQLQKKDEACQEELATVGDLRNSLSKLQEENKFTAAKGGDATV